MTTHKVFCNCKRCEESREKEKRLRTKRNVPKHAMFAWLETQTKKEQEMLDRGMYKMTCPKCKHMTYVKIGPEMKCQACMFVVK